MSDTLRQICLAREPNGHPDEGRCSVTRCPDPVFRVVEVGGGHGRNTCTTLIRLCAEHGARLRDQLQ